MYVCKIDKWTAIAIVVANMIGTGVFTSLGFQLVNITNAWSIAFLWGIGGIVALSGAFIYAEIGSYLVKNGGEYNYLGKLFHPAIGFTAGFVSVVVGFAAPVAAASVAFGKYLSYSFFIQQHSFIQIIISLIVLLSIACIHLLSIKTGSVFQKYITLLKLIIMSTFLFAFFNSNENPQSFLWNTNGILSDIFSSAFAVSLVYVSYSYSGWNAAAYIAGEIENPQKNLSKALITGTFTVVFFYVALNLSFLYSSPISALKGNVEVGIISARYILGQKTGNIIGLLISLLLISTISSMLIASPRVLTSMAEDYRIFSVFGKRNKYQSPYVAMLTIVGISAVMIITSSFQWLINFIGITLIFFTMLTTIGLFKLRKKKGYQAIFKTPLYPITPIFFILVNIWIVIYVSFQHVSAFVMSLVVILSGLILYKIAIYSKR